jgi:hypothetical protein
MCHVDATSHKAYQLGISITKTSLLPSGRLVCALLGVAFSWTIIMSCETPWGLGTAPLSLISAAPHELGTCEPLLHLGLVRLPRGTYVHRPAIIRSLTFPLATC